MQEAFTIMLFGGIVTLLAGVALFLVIKKSSLKFSPEKDDPGQDVIKVKRTQLIACYEKDIDGITEEMLKEHRGLYSRYGHALTNLSYFKATRKTHVFVLRHMVESYLERGDLHEIITEGSDE